MKYNPDLHHRRSIRLEGYDYSHAGAYFVTVCTQGRKNLFGEVKNGEMVLNPAGEMVRRVWDNLPEKFPAVELDEFMIMPNHVHGILVIKELVGAIHELPVQRPIQKTAEFNRKIRRQMLLPKIVGRFKMNSAKRVNEQRKTPGLPVWQRNYYEHIIRDEKKLNQIREYMAANPKRWEFDGENPGGRTDSVEKNFWAELALDKKGWR